MAAGGSLGVTCGAAAVAITGGLAVPIVPIAAVAGVLLGFIIALIPSPTKVLDCKKGLYFAEQNRVQVTLTPTPTVCLPCPISYTTGKLCHYVCGNRMQSSAIHQ